MEHPDITYIRTNGYTRQQMRSKELICPKCDAELSFGDDTYVNRFDEYQGCCYCFKRVDAWEVLCGE